MLDRVGGDEGAHLTRSTAEVPAAQGDVATAHGFAAELRSPSAQSSRQGTRRAQGSTVRGAAESTNQDLPPRVGMLGSGAPTPTPQISVTATTAVLPPQSRPAAQTATGASDAQTPGRASPGDRELPEESQARAPAGAASPSVDKQRPRVLGPLGAATASAHRDFRRMLKVVSEPPQRRAGAMRGATWKVLPACYLSQFTHLPARACSRSMQSLTPLYQTCPHTRIGMQVRGVAALPRDSSVAPVLHEIPEVACAVRDLVHGAAPPQQPPARCLRPARLCTSSRSHPHN